MRRTSLAAAGFVLLASIAMPAAAADCTRTSVGRTPIDDLGAGTYQGFEAGLYPGGTNQRPAAYTAFGESLARLAVPRNVAGQPDPTSGTSVLLTIGMSNTSIESTAFAALAQADPLRHPRVRVVNGAQGGQDAETIANPAATYWSNVDQRLGSQGLTPLQVQAVWLKEAIAGPQRFGGFPASAQRLHDDLAAILRILKARYPNLWLVYASSRIYAGYATTTLNPEPYAYESAFSVRWLVADRIASPVPILDADGGLVPWVSWGPYLWADGLVPRSSDGLTWQCADLRDDGTHPSASGADKVARELLDFFHSDQTARIFYEQAGGPPT